MGSFQGVPKAVCSTCIRRRFIETLFPPEEGRRKEGRKEGKVYLLGWPGGSSLEGLGYRLGKLPVATSYIA